MRYISLFLMSFLLLMAGCDDERTEMFLNIVSADTDFDASAGVGTIVYESEERVLAVSNKTWLTVSGVTENQLTFEVAANEELMSRTAVITLQAGESVRTVPVTQMGAVVGLEDVYEIGMLNEEYDYELYTNYNNLVVDVADNWVSVGIKDGRLVITPEVNYGEQRSTTFTITAGKKVGKATIVQEALSDATPILLEQKASSASFTVNADINKIDANWDAVCEADWLTVVKNGQTVRVQVGANETGKLRKSEINILVGGKAVLTIPVSQSGITDYYTYFLGDWILMYVDEETSKMTAVRVNLAPNEDNTGYLMTGLLLPVEVGYDKSTHQLSLTYQYMGLYGEHYIHLCPIVGRGRAWQEGSGYDIVFNGDEENNVLAFKDNGVLGSAISGLSFFAFSTLEPSDKTMLGYYENYYYMTAMYR